MKCDELEELYAGQFSPSARVYGALYVNEAIAELKEFAEDACLERDDNQNAIDELQAENAEIKANLDKAIAERDGNQVCIDAIKKYIYRLKEEKAQLKDKLEQEQSLRSHWNEDDYAMVNELERLSNENEKLKQKLESVQASMYADVVDANMENRRLKRALWIARAKWARSSALSYHLIESHPDKDASATYKRKANKWEKVKDKCLKKAEEYR